MKRKRKKKILILSASPIRDKYIDELIAKRLRELGNEVWVKPSPDEGEQSVIKFKPNVVVVPPIRNAYGRDFAEQLKRWGMGVVVRHTEPSCSKEDFEKMNPMDKATIFGHFSYQADLELVWSKDEAEILNKRKTDFKVIPIGSVSVALYKNKILSRKSREEFNKEKGFDNSKRNLVIGSAWGFIDHSPDKHIDMNEAAQRDLEGRKRWIEMIQAVYKVFGSAWNILLTVHPNIDFRPYKALTEKTTMHFDSKSPAFDLLTNADCLIHAGSTMGVAMHILGKPAFQYGDQNVKEGSWWEVADSPISKVSPRAQNIQHLLNFIGHCPNKSNANPEALKALEKGRYGSMDGKACIRAADEINKIDGKFNLTWPLSHRDYTQITVLRDARRVLTTIKCGVCKQEFVIVNDSWLGMLGQFLGQKIEIDIQRCCPWCGYRMMAIPRYEEHD